MNQKAHKSILFWILFTLVAKQVVWVGIIPLWHFPDEQAHFGQVQNYAEYGIFANKNSSDEIAISEQLLGVFRDERGNNKYTFHPEYNIDYTNDYIGLYEENIKDLTSKRAESYQNLSEATTYPPVYYILSSWVYKLFYSSDLFIRNTAVRMLSVLLFTINIWIVFLIGKQLKQQLASCIPKELFPVVLAVIVGFQPMFSFVGASVNSDVLFNLLFTTLIYGGLVIINKENEKGKKYYGCGLVALSLILGIMTKQQMVIGFMILPILLLPYVDVIRKFLSHNRGQISWSRRIQIFLGLVLFISITLTATKFGELPRVIGFLQTIQPQQSIGFFDHLYWTAIHTYREVVPWYWEVFKWLGITYPRWVYRVQMLFLLISCLGLLIYLCQGLRFKNNRIDGKKIFISFITYISTNRTVLYLIYVVVVYFLAITVFDWRFRISHGFPFGVQGRYFFPTIAAQMALLLIGFVYFVKFLVDKVSMFSSLSKRVEVDKYVCNLPKLACFALFIWWLTFHTIALITVANSYYQISSWQIFVIQASQYKPLLFKGLWWTLYISIYILSSGYLVLLVRRKFKHEA